MPDPTEEEIRNGWTKDALDRYLAERAQAQSHVIARHPEYRETPRPVVANGKYRPHRWRS